MKERIAADRELVSDIIEVCVDFKPRVDCKECIK